MISGDIPLGRLLDEHPELVEVLASYHPHFKQLRNKLLRRVMAPRVTVAQAARIAGVSADDLLTTLRRVVEEGDPTPHPALAGGHPTGPRALCQDHGRRQGARAR